MECIVLAGGLGTRLRSVVAELPKCMAPVAANPFLHYIFTYLQRQNVSHVILSVGYKYEAIQTWIEQTKWPFAVSYAIENEPLGTGGAIKLALQKATEKHVLIINGDTFFDVDVAQLYSNHIEKKADLTLALKPMNKFDRYGNVLLNEQNRITSFMEKQFCDQGQINGGVYLIESNSGLMENQETKFSFETEILQKHFSDHSFYGHISNGYFIDIGIPEDFEKANLEFKTLFA